MEKKIGIAIIAAVLTLLMIVIVSIMIYITNLKKEVAALNIQLHTIERTKPYQTNEDFLYSFFNYKNTKQRYEEAQKFMTETGFRSTHPSSIEIPESSEESVSSKVLNLRSFEHAEDKTSSKFYNEIEIQTTFNGESSSQKILVLTKLIFTNENWKVDNFEFLLNDL